MHRKELLPDTFSFVQKSIDDFFEKIHNEFNLSLRNAIREFTEFHVYCCNYLGVIAEPKFLTIYYHFNYDSCENLATLEKIYFVSPEARHILTTNYLKDIEPDNPQAKTKKCGCGRKRSNAEDELFEYEEKFKGLTFFADYNHLEVLEAKKILMECSRLREKNKQLLILKNLNRNYEDSQLKDVVIKFDLSFFSKCSFFENDRYVSFKKILPPNLIVELPVSLEYDLIPVPEKLKKDQLIDLNSLKMNIS